VQDVDVREEPGHRVEGPGRTRRWSRVRGLVPLALGSLLLLLGVLLLEVADPDPLSPQTRVGLLVLLALGVLAGAGAWLLDRRGRWAPEVVVGLTAWYASTVLATSLHGTPYPMDGLSADSGYKAESVTRFASTWANVDFTYKGLPSFYPPVLPYVAGRMAALLHLFPPHALQITTIVFTLLVPVVSYALWQRVVSRRLAALLTLTVLVVQIALQTDSWLSLFAVVPFWLDTVLGIRREGVARRNPVLAGVICAVLACTYYYYFFILAVSLLLLPLLRRWHPLSEPRPWRYRLVVGGVALLVSAVYWLPFAVSLLTAQEPQSLQNLWFQEKMVHLPLPMLDASVVGVVSLLGTGHLALTARRDRLSGGLAALVCAAYAWYVLGLAAVVVGKPVLVFRTDQVISLLLAVAGVRALVELARLALVRWPGADTRRVLLVGGVALTYAVGQMYMVAVAQDRRIPDAHAESLPSGALPRFHPDSARKSPYASMSTIIATVKAGYTGPDEPVVLTSRSDILAVEPFYGFNQWTSHYAHPAGEFRARLAFLRTLAAEKDPARFAQLSDGNRFDRIDAFVLRDTSKGLRYRAADDAFPKGSVRVEVYFDRAQFDPAQFTVTALPGYLVAVRR